MTKISFFRFAAFPQFVMTANRIIFEHLCVCAFDGVSRVRAERGTRLVIQDEMRSVSGLMCARVT